MHTRQVSDLQPLDLLFFAPTTDAYGAHLAVYLGDNEAIHLARAVGKPATWPVERFATVERYRTFIGAKRMLTSPSKFLPPGL